MGFINRITIVLCMFSFSFMSVATSQMSGLSQFAISLIFWFAFFWWFDNTFFTVEQIQKMIEESNKENKDGN